MCVYEKREKKTAKLEEAQQRGNEMKNVDDGWEWERQREKKKRLSQVFLRGCQAKSTLRRFGTIYNISLSLSLVESSRWDKRKWAFIQAL